MSQPNSRERLISAALRLFAEKGIKGTSVRTLCDEAEVGLNMVVHHFGSKEGLVSEILRTASPEMYHTPLRVISEPARDAADFQVRMRLFCEETLQSILDHEDLLTIVYNWSEVMHLPAYKEAMQGVVRYQQAFTEFLESARAIGVVRGDADLSMIGGLLWDRFATAVLHRRPITQIFEGADIADPDFRGPWIQANVDIFLRGVLA